jgi:hypothetical protein
MSEATVCSDMTATHTRQLAPVFETDVSGVANLSLDALAGITRHVRRFIDRHGDNDAYGTLWGARGGLDDPHLLGDRERVFLTRRDAPKRAEVVHVAPVNETVVRVTFPERAALDSDGDDTLYSYTAPATRLLDRMHADDGWIEVRPFERLQTTVACPECGVFMAVRFDGSGYPVAECSVMDCHGWYDDRELLDAAAVENVF